MLFLTIQKNKMKQKLNKLIVAGLIANSLFTTVCQAQEKNSISISSLS